jgi:hypothetical protein
MKDLYLPLKEMSSWNRAIGKSEWCISEQGYGYQDIHERKIAEIELARSSKKPRRL